MNAVLWIFLAIAGGIMLFSALQEDLPEELAILKGDAPAEKVKFDKKEFTYKGWNVRQQDYTIELTRTMDGELSGVAGTFKPPVLGVLCHEGKLDMRIDTGYALTGTKTTQVRVNGDRQVWVKGQGTNVFPPKPKTLLNDIVTKETPLSVNLSYVDLGSNSFTLDAEGLKELKPQLPKSCQ